MLPHNIFVIGLLVSTLLGPSPASANDCVLKEGVSQSVVEYFQKFGKDIPRQFCNGYEEVDDVTTIHDDPVADPDVRPAPDLPPAVEYNVVPRDDEDLGVVPVEPDTGDRVIRKGREIIVGPEGVVVDLPRFHLQFQFR